MKQYVDTLSGNGKLQIEGRPERNVSYSIEVYQDIVSAGDEMIAGLLSYDVNIPGITVNVWFGEATLILEDGRIIPILIDSNGIKAMGGPK